MVREIMAFLFSHGVSTARAFRIYKTYGEQAIATVGAVTGATGTELDVFREKAQQLGITTRFTATEAADINDAPTGGWLAATHEVTNTATALAELNLYESDVAPREAVLRPLSATEAEVDLLAPEEGVSPGQACVFYEPGGSRVLGGGWIWRGRG